MVEQWTENPRVTSSSLVPGNYISRTCYYTFMFSLLNTVSYFWETHLSNFHSRKSILTLSGGQDSIIMFFLIFLLKPNWQIDITTLYCNHGWRDWSIVSHSNLLKFTYLVQVPYTNWCDLNSRHTEESARDWRRFCYSRTLIVFKASFISLGHSSTDKIETFFFNLARGAGSQIINSVKVKKKIKLHSAIGFSSKRTHKFKKISFKNVTCTQVLQPDPQQPWFEIIRPIIFLNRYEINKVCLFLNLPIQVDQTNFRLKYCRNRLRHQVLPLFREYLNSNFDLKVVQFLKSTEEDFTYLNNLVLKTFSLLPLKIYKTKIVLTKGNWATFLPFAIQKRLIIFLLTNSPFIDTTKPLPAYTFREIELILKISLLTSASNERLHKSEQIFLFNKTILLIVCGNYWLLKKIGSDGI